MTWRKCALVLLVFVLVVLVLLVRGRALAGETKLTVPTTDGPVVVALFPATGEAKRPSVLVLHGSRGIVPAAGYQRYAAGLAAAGMDAWLFSYCRAEDETVMGSADRARRNERYTARFPAWMKTVEDIVGFALAGAESSGRVGVLGFSNGGFLAVGTAAADPRINALVVFYAGIPGPPEKVTTRLPPLLELHGDADQVIPIAEGRALVDRAKALGGFAEQVVYPGADHGFDFTPDSYAGDDAIARAVGFLRHQLGAD